jgi:hypothetical protein
MGQITKIKKLKGANKQFHPLSGSAKEYTENILTPVTLCGVVVPWSEAFSDGRSSDYKLACASGAEYFIVADQEWREVLSEHCWEEVKVKGLLNVSNMTLIPQRVFPKGPTGERENVIDLPTCKDREFIKKVKKNLDELVFVPIALWALMA